jgi:hypothetical protein
MLLNCQQSCDSCVETNGLLRKGNKPAQGNDKDGRPTKRPKTTDEGKKGKKAEKGSKKGKQAWKSQATKKLPWKGKGNGKVKHG